MRLLPRFRATPRRLAPVVCAASAVAILLSGGCGYSIQGRVVKGQMGLVQWVAGDGAALGEPVEGAVVSIVRDPNGLSPSEAGRAVSAADGTFVLSIGAFGAGWMEEVWLIRASRSGVGSAETIERLPASTNGQTMVISLAKTLIDVGRAPTNQLWQGDVGRGESADSLVEEMKRYR